MPDYDLGTARGRIELDASSLGRATAAFTGLGRAMTGTGVLAVGAFAYAIKSAADFEKQMSAVDAVTNGTASQMEAMKEVALDLGASTVYGANEIGRAMEQLAKAGIDIDDILNGATQATVNLAAAAGDELAGGIDEAAVVIANAMKTFGASADQLDHFANVLVGAAASSTLSVDDIATSMRYAGPVAASLGLSIDDLSTALAILGDRGIRGSTAGTSLRGVFLSLASQTPKATKVLKDLGIITADGTNRFFDLNGAMKPLPEVMQILGDATRNLSEQEKIAAFNAIFQRRAMNSAMILAEQGAEGFYEYAEAIGAIDASDVAATKLDNLSGDVTLLRNALETLIIRVGLPFQEMMRGFVQNITDVVSALNQMNPELLAQVAMYTAIGGAVLIAAGGFLMLVGVAIRLYRNFVVLMEAVRLVVGAMRLLTLSFLTNPITLFVVALAAVAAALYLAYQRSEEFRERVDAALNALRPAFEAVVGFVTNFIDQFGNLIDVLRRGDDVAQGVAEVIDNMFGNTGALVGPIRSLVMAMQQVDDVARRAFDYFANVILPVLWDFSIAVGQAVGSAVAWFIDEGIPAITDFASSVMDQLGMAVGWLDRNVVPIFQSVAEFIVAAIDRIIRVIDFFWPVFEMAWGRAVVAIQTAWAIIQTIVQNILIVWSNFGDNIVRYVVGAWNRIKQTIESALRIIRGIIQTITGIISGDWGKAWEGIKNIVSGAWSLIGDLIQNAWFQIWNLLSMGVDALISLWEVGWNTIGDAIGIAWNFITGIVSNGANMIRGLISNGLNLIRNIFTSIWNTIMSFLAGVFSRIVNSVSSTIGSVVNFFRRLPGQVVSAVGNLANTLYQKGKDLVDGMKRGVEWVWNSVRNFFSRLPDRIKGFIGDVGNLLYNIGKDIIGGLIDGIQDMIPSLGDVVGGIGGFITDLKGPPAYDKVMLTPQGQWIMQGLMRGIESQIPALKSLVSSISPSIVQTVSATGSSLAGPIASSGDGPTVTNITFEFPNVTSAQEAQGIEDAINNDSVLTQLVSAIKAGRR